MVWPFFFLLLKVLCLSLTSLCDYYCFIFQALAANGADLNEKDNRGNKLQQG